MLVRALDELLVETVVFVLYDVCLEENVCKFDYSIRDNGTISTAVPERTEDL